MSTYMLYGCGTSQGPQRPSTYPPDVVLPGEANPPVAEPTINHIDDETDGNYSNCHGCRSWLKSSVWYAPQSSSHATLLQDSALNRGCDVRPSDDRRAGMCGFCVRKQ